MGDRFESWCGFWSSVHPTAAAVLRQGAGRIHFLVAPFVDNGDVIAASTEVAASVLEESVRDLEKIGLVCRGRVEATSDFELVGRRLWRESLALLPRGLRM